MAIEVTVRDTETGDTETQTVEDDYVVVCAGTCHLTHTQTSANGTHVLTIKGRRGA